MFGLEERRSNICIADIPAGAKVKLKTISGCSYEGYVIANYGASMAVKMNQDKIVAVENGDILIFEIIGKDSCDEFQINRARDNAKFKILFEKIDSSFMRGEG